MKALRIAAGCALALSTSLAMAPSTVDAQFVVRQVSRGMLGVMTEAVPGGATGSQRRVIVDVVPGSAAERAGLIVGDTIVQINGAAATQRVMNAGFDPGETVQLRVRRGGRERTVSVVATERQESGFVYSRELPDSLRGRISIIMEAVQADMDTLRNRVWVATGDSSFVYHFGTDSLAGAYRLRGAYGRAHLDSLRAHFENVQGAWPRMITDSLLFGAQGNVWAYSVGRDSMNFMRPAEIVAQGFSLGMRAVAGAELSELNPALAEYFGTNDGILVLNARDGTPAERAGLRAGDVIQSAGGTAVSTIVDLRRAIERTPRGQNITLRVLRRGQAMDLTLGTQRD